MRLSGHGWAGFALAAGLLPACTDLGPRAEVSLAAELPDAFARTGERAQLPRWWLAFGDAGMTAFIEEAMERSPTIRSAWDRLAAAGALARVAGAATGPDVTLSADGARQVRTEATDANDIGLRIAASYEVDLWGRVAATVDSARLDAEATRWDLYTASVTLSAEIAAAWVELTERRAQLALIDRQVRTSESQRELIELRFQVGEADAEDLLRQRQLVVALRGDRFPILARIEVLEHRLAVLAGLAPGTREIGAGAELGDPPPLPGTGAPLALIAARPDLQAALAGVRAVDRDVAAAIADQFPRLTLAPSLSAGGESVGTFFTSWLFSIAAGVVAPVFDSGSRTAEVERQRALLSLAINEYERTALAALAEVEDALAREARQRELIANLREQIALGAQILDGLSLRYTQGTANYLDVLSARDTLQDLERTLLAARRDLMVIHVDLARSLAGGWVPAAAAPRVPDAPVGDAEGGTS